MLGSRRRAEKLIQSLRSEIAELRDETARLRSDQQRPLDPHGVAAELHDMRVAASLRGPNGGERVAFTYRQELLDLQVIRQGLIDVCTNLQVLAGQLHRQLSEGAPAPEIDRRVTDLAAGHSRRRDDRRSDRGKPHGAPPAKGPGNGHAEPGVLVNGALDGRTEAKSSQNSADRGSRSDNGSPPNGQAGHHLNWSSPGPSSATRREDDRDHREDP